MGQPPPSTLDQKVQKMGNFKLKTFTLIHNQKVQIFRLCPILRDDFPIDRQIIYTIVYPKSPIVIPIVVYINKKSENYRNAHFYQLRSLKQKLTMALDNLYLALVQKGVPSILPIINVSKCILCHGRPNNFLSSQYKTRQTQLT